MDNQLQKPIGGLSLPVPLTEEYAPYRHNKLIELIDKPQWAGTKPNGEPFVKQAELTLIPDLISIVNSNGEYQFVIFDAKYYNIQLEHNKKLRGQPGIESITKWHNEIILLCLIAEKPCATGIFDKKKRTKVAIPMVS